MAFSDLELEVAAEFDGFRGAREFFGADGYTFRRLGRLSDDGFEKLTAALRSKKWKREHPEACRLQKAESIRRLMLTDPDGQRAMRRRRKKKWEAKNPERVRAMGRRAHERRSADLDFRRRAVERATAHYEKTKADPAKLEALRAYKREWARKRAAELLAIREATP